ncbi:MAG: T9SS type A sorting domain-containing protein [bacterium]
MKVLIALCVFTLFVLAGTPIKIDVADGATPQRSPDPLRWDHMLIDSVGDIRGVLGPQGKSIAVSRNGEAIAVIYGATTGDPNNTMKIKVAYSTNGGVTWQKHGPFSGDFRRMFPCVDATPNFHTNPGEIFFVWHESPLGYMTGTVEFMIDSNIPASPLFSVPSSLPSSTGQACFWSPCIAVDPDDPTNLIVTAYRYLANGNLWAYAWVSNDAGLTWTDTIPMCHISVDGYAGHMRRGPGGYVLYVYLDYYQYSAADSIIYPCYMESVDGGYTWSVETQFPGFPAGPGMQYWWTDLDCEVINGEPWAAFTDLGTPGGGPYIIRGSGSPGNWTWTIWDAQIYGSDSSWVGGGLWSVRPSDAPSLSYDPQTGTILVSYSAFYYMGDSVSSVLNGVHIGGIFSSDNGEHWTITNPLSAPNNGEINYYDWIATEVAHNCVAGMYWPYGFRINSYGVWVHAVDGLLYFERGVPVGIEEYIDPSYVHCAFYILPTIIARYGKVFFKVEKCSNAHLVLYDVAGRFVHSLFTGILDQGNYKMDLNVSHLATGTYLLILETKAGQQVEKIVVAR